ncbi:MAG: hypothetical protein HOK83_16715 [Rhodospirillaceae bacterium]|nr:hypothetical protein [Rhodospirillaceae bacterium]
MAHPNEPFPVVKGAFGLTWIMALCKNCPIVIVMAVAAIALPSLAQTFPGSLDSMQEFRVVAVHDGDTVALDDGRQLRLVGISAPKFSSGYQTDEKQPLARAAT